MTSKRTASILLALLRKDAALVKWPLLFCYLAMVASLVLKLQLLPYYNQVSSRWPEAAFSGLANFVGLFFLIILGFMIYGVQVQSFWEDSVTNASGFMGSRPVDRRLSLAAKLLGFYLLLLAPYWLTLYGLVAPGIRNYPLLMVTLCALTGTLFHLCFIPAVVLPTPKLYYMAIAACLVVGMGTASFLESRHLGLAPRIEFAEDYQYAYLFNALFAVWLLVSLGAMLSFCHWRLYRWPLGLVLAGVGITFTLFFRVEAYVMQGYRRVYQVASVQEYMDVRWKNLGGLDLRQHPDYPATFWFNDQTIWPMTDRMPAGVDPGVLLTNAMNPGLGVRALQAQGITGRGVNVGIIDQPLYPDHPEYSGKIAAYHDVGCNSESSMHGPGVTSLLVGKACGTAPGARVYYVAAPSWLGDSLYFAQALEWLVRKNQQLPAGEKIRVVSVSAAPSGKGSPFKKNQEAWDQAVEKAEQAGMLVLDCTSHHGFIGPAFFPTGDRESVSNCVPGVPGQEMRSAFQRRLFVPNSPRSTAEHYQADQASYQYTGRGGLSWAIPYCAGVLAMGWQVNPQLTGPEMRELLFQSAYRTPSQWMVINPPEFIRLVRHRLPPGK